MRNLPVYILSFILGRKTLYNFNLNIIKLFFVFISNNNFFSFKASGEELFLNKICNESPQLCIDFGANVGNYSKYMQIEYNRHHMFKNVNLYKFSKLLKNYNVYKILPHSSGLLKIEAKSPENNYCNYSNYVINIIR